MTTIEEKARRYDEALERAKNTIEVNQAIPDIVECVESLFPELSESEDEKIRKALIEHVKGIYKDSCTEEISKERDMFLTWLEKQGELVNSLSKGLDNAHERIDELIQKNNLLIEQLEKQGEQNVNRETKPRTYGDFIKRLTESEQEYLQGYVNKVIEKTKELQKQGELKPIKEHNVCDFCEDRYGCVNPCPVKLIEQKPTDKIEPKFKIGDTMRTLQEAKDGWTDGMPIVVSIDNEYYHCNNESIAIKNQDEYEYPPMNRKHDICDSCDEQKSFSKYKVGDTVYYNSFGRFVSFVIANIVEDGTDNPMYEDKDGNSVFQNDIFEHEPDDMAEPKFKVGDWVVDKNGTTRQILSYKDGIYKHTDGYSATIFEDEWRMWDIAKDAKDGDVIYSRHNTESFEWIGIFRSLDKENKRVFFYGFWNSIVKSFCVCEDEAYVLYDDFSPATKEQRDALMKAMIDAGYTFDFEKKELKKIEQNPADKIEQKSVCSEDRSKELSLSLQIQSYLNTASDELYAKGKSLYSEKRIEDIHKCMLMWQKLHNAYFYQNPAWNEEDEKMLDDILMCGEHHCYLDAENIDWLKSLKERMQPQQKRKPWSEEDEKMFVNIKSALQNANKDYSREIGWFHLLRLQKQWRPSEKQINALSDVLSLRDIKYDVLSELLECLKKRREEQL